MGDVIDCGDSSCLFAPKKSGMRTNGGCRCYRNAGFADSGTMAAQQMLPEIARLRAEVELQQRQFEEFAERSADDIGTLRAEVERWKDACEHEIDKARKVQTALSAELAATLAEVEALRRVRELVLKYQRAWLDDESFYDGVGAAIRADLFSAALDAAKEK